MDLSKLKDIMKECYPDEYDSIQLQEGVNQLCNWFLKSNLMEKLAEEIEKEEKEIDEVIRMQNKYKRIGGVAGASVVGGTTAVIGAGVASFIAAPVVVPVAVVGTCVAAGIGYFGGKVGGTVVAMLDKIKPN